MSDKKHLPLCITKQAICPGGTSGKEPACQHKRWKRHEFDLIRSLGQKAAQEEGMAIHSSALAWRI